MYIVLASKELTVISLGSRIQLTAHFPSSLTLQWAPVVVLRDTGTGCNNRTGRGRGVF